MKTMINMLPHAHRKQQMLRKRATQWGTLLCVVMAVAGMWHWHESREHTLLTQQVGGLMREHAPIQALLHQLAEMRQELQSLQQLEATAAELEYQRNALTLLALVSQAARHSDGRLRVTAFDLNDFQSPVAGEPSGRGAADSLVRRPAPLPGQVGSLRVAGVSLDNSVVGELLDSLQDSGLFSRVELQSLKERQGEEISYRDYEIRCEF